MPHIKYMFSFRRFWVIHSRISAIQCSKFLICKFPSDILNKLSKYIYIYLSIWSIIHILLTFNIKNGAYYVWVCMCDFMYVCKWVYMCTFAYVFVYVCMCVCVRERVCARFAGKENKLREYKSKSILQMMHI